MSRDTNTVRARPVATEDGLVFELSGDTDSMNTFLDALDGRVTDHDTFDDGVPDGYGATVWPTSLDTSRDELAQFLRDASNAGRVDLVIERAET